MADFLGRRLWPFKEYSEASRKFLLIYSVNCGTVCEAYNGWDSYEAIEQIDLNKYRIY